MNWFSWLAQEKQFSDGVQTVRAQTLPPLEQDRLVADLFFPRQDVNTMKLEEIITSEYRFVADRRDWNARGRLIHIPTPTRKEMEFIPVESYFTVEEREINDLLTRTDGDANQIRRLLGVSIAARTDGLVRANQRRLELDALQAWHAGTVTVRNPQTGDSYTVSYGDPVDRRQAAATAWDNVGVNAWDEFLAWIQEANDAVPGGVSRVVTRKNVYDAIFADAPLATVSGGLVNRAISRKEFEDMLANTLGFRVGFIILENWLDVYTGAGLVTQRQRVWGSGIIAAVPNRTAVGYMAYAPVVRAYELANLHPDAKIDKRGMAVYKEISSNGRMLTNECQVNAFPVTQEQYIFVMDTGIVSPMTA